jgi:hypothetical protein
MVVWFIVVRDDVSEWLVGWFGRSGVARQAVAELKVAGAEDLQWSTSGQVRHDPLITDSESLVQMSMYRTLPLIIFITSYCYLLRENSLLDS